MHYYLIDDVFALLLTRNSFSPQSGSRIVEKPMMATMSNNTYIQKEIVFFRLRYTYIRMLHKQYWANVYIH